MDQYHHCELQVLDLNGPGGGGKPGRVTQHTNVSIFVFGFFCLLVLDVTHNI